MKEAWIINRFRQFVDERHYEIVLVAASTTIGVRFSTVFDHSTIKHYINPANMLTNGYASGVSDCVSIHSRRETADVRSSSSNYRVCRFAGARRSDANTLIIRLLTNFPPPSFYRLGRIHTAQCLVLSAGHAALVMRRARADVLLYCKLADKSLNFSQLVTKR